MILALLGAATLALWVYLLAFRGGFWRMEPGPAMGAPVPPLPSVVAVIPARNEADLVGLAIRSLARQDYGGQFHIVLVDDGSRTARPAWRVRRREPNCLPWFERPRYQMAGAASSGP